MASKSTSLSIKLLVDRERNCVIGAEVSNDFVDTLRSLLTFTLGNIARLVSKHQSLHPGCLNNLYNSVENIGLNSFRTNACKRMLLSPRSIHQGKFKNLKLNMDTTEPTKYFLCRNPNCSQGIRCMLSYYSETIRCGCGNLINKETSPEHVEIEAVKDETGGVLHNVESMFFITDDLRVMQGFPGDLIRFLLSLGVKNVSQVEEKVLEIGSEEMSNLLSRSLVSKTTLTDVFLRKQGTLGSAPMLDEQFMLVAPMMKETTENDNKIRVKLILRKSDRKILYAEATEDFVDLIFSFLTIPLESVLELFGGNGNITVGSITNLFKDLETMFYTTKQNNSEEGVLPPFYSCLKEFPSIRCKKPPAYKDIYLRLVDPKSPKPNTTNSSGYIKKDSLFVISDDLVVKSLSSVSSISLLREIGIQLDDVEQQVISIGNVEALALWRSCLCSSSALSTSLSS